MNNKIGSEIKPRVMIMDSDSAVRARTHEVLAQDTAIEIVAEATNIIEMLAKVNLKQPNIILVNLAFGGGGHLRIFKEIKTNHPDIRIIAVAVSDGCEYYLELPEIEDSNTCEVKVGSPAAFLLYLRGLSGSTTSSSNSLNPGILSNLAEDVQRRIYGSLNIHLTPREEQVLRLLADGKSNVEISEILTLKPSTVRTHRAVLMAKMGLPDSMDLIKLAVTNGLIKLSSPGTKGDKL